MNIKKEPWTPSFKNYILRKGSRTYFDFISINWIWLKCILRRDAKDDGRTWLLRFPSAMKRVDQSKTEAQSYPILRILDKLRSISNFDLTQFPHTSYMWGSKNQDNTDIYRTQLFLLSRSIVFPVYFLRAVVDELIPNCLHNIFK